MHAVQLHLDAGSDLHQSLGDFAAQQSASGFVLSVVGNLSQAAFQCPGQAQPTLLRGDLELIALQGTLAPGGIHLHLCVSDGTCQVWGGHLEPGTLVQKGVDLLVGLLEAPQPTGCAEDSHSPAVDGSTSRVQILVRHGCPWCRRALRLLQSQGIEHQIHEAREPGPVPRIWIDGVLIGGYDALMDLQAAGRLQQLRQV
jgi:predicted DNA-binding protein with PD1-like motif/glutaredoxin